MFCGEKLFQVFPDYLLLFPSLKYQMAPLQGCSVIVRGMTQALGKDRLLFRTNHYR